MMIIMLMKMIGRFGYESIEDGNEGENKYGLVPTT